jgi:hypothetical protein
VRMEKARAGQLDAVRISEFGVSVTVVPQLGAKIASIVWQAEEFLFQNASRSLRAARYGAPYSEFDASGFDECVPSIGACLYPAQPWEEVMVPDHGEIWSIPWTVEQASSVLRCSVDGVRLPYRFSRSMELLPDPGLRLKYRIENCSQLTFPFIWSAHPLLRIDRGMRLYLPEAVSLIIDWSKNERLGMPLCNLPWPVAIDRNGNRVDLSVIEGAEAGVVDKLYTSRLQEGWCGLHDPATGRWVAMVFRTDLIPYLGLSINQGGWPMDGPGYFNLGLEPCNGFPDRLDLAIKHGSYTTVGPNDSLDWQFDLLLGRDDCFPVDRLRALANEAMVA